MFDDTIAAIATAPGEAGIGIIRLSGPIAINILNKVFKAKRSKSVFDMPSRVVCYGYIVDTDHNRSLLKRGFVCGWYRIVDQRVRKELQDEALAAGMLIEAAPKQDYYVKYTVKEKKAISEVDELKKQITELQQTIRTAAQTGEARIIRPLDGVKIDGRRRKEIKEADAN